MLKIEAGSKLLFIGDSITDKDRVRPHGEGLFDPFGFGYVAFANALLNSTYPNNPIRVVNKGCSGDTTRNLLERWEEDCINQKPDWLAIMIGINDVWRHFDMPLFPEVQVSLEEYEQNLTKMIKAVQGQVKQIVLITPYFIESNTQDSVRMMMTQYADVVKKLSKTFSTILVDTQEAFDEYLKYYHSANISWDRIHPNNTGHMIIARAFLKTVGYEF